MINTYQPCFSNDPGDNTTHCQYQRYVDATKDLRSPRKAFLQDLGVFIQLSMDSGGQVALLMDCNEDVCSEGFTSWLQDHLLHDCVLEKCDRMNAPATHNGGSKPIDGIFCSSTLDIKMWLPTLWCLSF